MIENSYLDFFQSGSRIVDKMPALTSKKTPIWISHRGYCAQATENTRESFQAARNLGFKVIETDLRISKDNQLFLLHDLDLKRLTGTSELVTSMTRSALEKVRFKNDEKIVFFDEFIYEFSDFSWVFDIKPEEGERVINTFFEQVIKTNFEAKLHTKTRYLFWNQAQEDLFEKQFPKAMVFARKPACAKLCLYLWGGLNIKRMINPQKTYSLPPSFWGKKYFKPAIVEKVHESGAKVLAFLPSTESESQDAIKSGFDEILTDGKIIDAN